jgi:RNA polymerase sigma factor (sigma-70 family)
MIRTDNVNLGSNGLRKLAGVYMHIDGEDILEELEVAIERLRDEEPEIGAAVGSILRDNWADGRIEKFFNSKTEDTINDYVERVIKYYRKCHEYVSRIESDDEAAWDHLLEKLRKWAYAFLKKKGVPYQADLFQIANDCANDACLRLLNVRFPYDVHYESWACRVVQNVTLNYIRQHTDKIEYADLDLNEAHEWLQALSVPDGTSRVEKRIDLLDAINQLNSEDRQRFILLYYFGGKSFAEIAEILDRTINALYKLHFDALENLRKILGEISDIKDDDEE